MNDAQKAALRATAATIIKKLERNNISGYYCDSSRDAIELVQKLVPTGSSVTWGGSETFRQTGVKDMLAAGAYHLIDGLAGETPEEQDRIWQEQSTADWMFMSSNAITIDGELINIDGNANRLSLLLHGPKHVCMLVGMNKVVADIESGFKRIRTVTCPANAARLHTGTPCEATGTCANCHTKACMCCQEVITRHSRHKGRIHVILIGESLGF